MPLHGLSAFHFLGTCLLPFVDIVGLGCPAGCGSSTSGHVILWRLSCALSCVARFGRQLLITAALAFIVAYIFHVRGQPPHVVPLILYRRHAISIEFVVGLANARCTGIESLLVNSIHIGDIKRSAAGIGGCRPMGSPITIVESAMRTSAWPIVPFGPSYCRVTWASNTVRRNSRKAATPSTIKYGVMHRYPGAMGLTSVGCIVVFSARYAIRIPSMMCAPEGTFILGSAMLVPRLGGRVPHPSLRMPTVSTPLQHDPQA